MAHTVLKIGDFLFQATSRELTRGRLTRRLTPKAAGVLTALAETPGQVWSRDAILERVWPGVIVGDEVLTHAVGDLRRALGDATNGAAYIETVHKSGYRLLAAVEPVKEERPPLGETAIDANGESFDLDAYGAYLHALAVFEKGDKRHLTEAADLFAETISAAPRFAPAYSGLAKSLAYLGAYYGAGPGAFQEAAAACGRAQSFDPDCAALYAAQGLTFALAGEYDRALTCFKTALRLNAESSETHYLLGRAAFAAGDYSFAAIMFERTAALRADEFHTLLIAAKARRAAGDETAASRNFAIAERRVRRHLNDYPDDRCALFTKAYCLVDAGDCEAATATLAGVESAIDSESFERSGGFVPAPLKYNLACAFARAGETDQALSCLEQACESGFRHSSLLEREPDFRTLAFEPRYRKLSAAIGAS